MYKILSVEDNPEVMEALSDTLELADFPVKRAYDGEEALEILKEEEFDLVVTDIMMPKKPGFDVIRYTKSHHPKTKIIAVSGGGNFISSRLTVSLANLEADICLQKPFDLDTFLNAIDRALKKSLHDNVQMQAV